MDLVGIRGLRLDAVIGVRDHERRRRQPVEIDVECGLDVQTASLTDDLAATVSYAEVRSVVAGAAAGKPHGLLEALAADCVAALFDAFVAIQTIELEVRKPRALGGDAVPYVRLSRRRGD